MLSKRILKTHWIVQKYWLCIIPEAEVIIYVQYYWYNFINKLVFWMHHHKTDAYAIKSHLLTGCLSDSIDLFMETNLMWIKLVMVQNAWVKVYDHFHLQKWQQVNKEEKKPP